jgi:3-methyladenine DNA glycosylase AlkC
VLFIKNEVIADFIYTMDMNAMAKTDSRKGARRLADVPEVVLADLAAGRCETVNLMEWLATDMAGLAQVVSLEADSEGLAHSLREASGRIGGLGVTQRLSVMGNAIARAAPVGGQSYSELMCHRSDIVRQWACYAANDVSLSMGLAERLSATIPFAKDRNMSVRETAWMAFRPHLTLALEEGLRLLAPLTLDDDGNVRRFAVEVTRPRSVWGSHIDQLKRAPQLALPLLVNVRSDPARYVQLAVGNWLNDASKTRPEWVENICAEWAEDGGRHAIFITRRGLRTLIRQKVKAECSASGRRGELL